MELGLSGDQELFLATTQRLLARDWPVSRVRDQLGAVDRDVLARGAEAGWTAPLVPEDLGGGSVSGEGVRDLGVLAEAFGAALLSGPVVATNVVAHALAGTDRLAKEHLPALVSGTRLATWALAEPSDRWRAEDGTAVAVRTPAGFRLTGVKTPVQDAHVADLLLVTVRGPDGVTRLLVDPTAPGVSITLLDGLDLTRRYCRVEFDDVEVDASALVGEPDGGAAAEHQFALALALQCAETVGATDRLYALTLDYVRDRKAFGRPIGSYQALKHRLAEMLLWLESAKAVTGAALGAVQAQRGALAAASLAKAYVADRCPAIVRDCLQMHGGIGFTWEHDLHLYLRRVETDAVILGGVDYHLDLLSTGIGF